MLRKLGVLAVSLALALVLVPVPTSAQAGTCPNGKPTPCIGGVVTVNPTPGGGAGTGGQIGSQTGTSGHGPGTGGSYVPVPDPPGVHYVTFTRRWTPPTTTDGIKSCPRKADGRYATGYVERQTLRYNGKPGPNGQDYNTEVLVYVSRACQWPPSPAITDVTCALSAKMTLTGPLAYNKTVMSAWASDRKNPAKCVTSMDMSVSMPLTKMGRYTLTGIGSLVPCKLYQYTGAQADEIRDCGGTVPSSWVKRAQVWCNDWSEDWSGKHSYTMDECRDVTSGWKCAPSSVTLGGRKVPATGKFSVLDDGKVWPAAWTPFKVTGGVKDAKPRTYLTVGGKPSRDGAKQGAKDQPYQAPAAGWVPGDIRTAQLQWYAPGVPSDPWTLARVVKFDAQFVSPKVTITSMNLKTWKMGVTESTTWRADSGTCPSATLTVAVNRARNFR